MLFNDIFDAVLALFMVRTVTLVISLSGMEKSMHSRTLIVISMIIMVIALKWLHLDYKISTGRVDI